MEKGNPVEQILHQPEGTEPSAYGPTQKAAEEKEKAQNPERNPESVLI